MVSVFQTGGVAACPPVVEYSRELQAQAAEELARLPDGSALIEMMADFAVKRAQALACYKRLRAQSPQMFNSASSNWKYSTLIRLSVPSGPTTVTVEDDVLVSV